MLVSMASGRAFAKFRDMVQTQGGDVRYIDEPERFEKAEVTEELSLFYQIQLIISTINLSGSGCCGPMTIQSCKYASALVTCSGLEPHGPHIFHTNIDRVYEYLSRFTQWYEYQHEVVGNVYGRELPIPFNLNTLEMVYGERAPHLEKLLIDNFGDAPQREPAYLPPAQS